MTKKLTLELKRKIRVLEQDIDYLRQIIDHIPANIFWKNRKGVYLGGSQRAAKSMGKSFIGKTLYDFLDKNTAEIWDKSDRKIMREKVEQTIEENFLDPGNNPVTLLSVKAPLFNNKNKVTGLLGASIDITKLKQAEKALVEAKEKAEEMSRMKSDFIHNMEHDIRTPFAGIYGMSSAMARQETDPEKRECLDLISESSKELLDYANHILAFAQIEEEYNKIVNEDFSIEKTVKSVINMEKPPAKIKNLSLRYSVANTVPEKVVGDLQRLKVILINLISNAIKFTEKGSVSIDVTMVKRNKTSANFYFRIHDTGIGIPKSKQKDIFEKFFRVNPSNQGLYKGFGLGLQIVKKFVEEVNGDIQLESDVNKGTTFTVRIPFQFVASKST
ncbi:MAG TPA: ATP-binding protein [Gammaproteobacteria bacterium]|nr:ATP-binding protein [Gammaproteobacteria bacterium]